MDDYMHIRKFCEEFGVDENDVNKLRNKGELPGKKDHKGAFVVNVRETIDKLNHTRHTTTMYTRKQLVQELRLQNQDWAEQAALLLERDIYNIENLRNKYAGQRYRAEQYKEYYEELLRKQRKFSLDT